MEDRQDDRQHFVAVAVVVAVALVAVGVGTLAVDCGGSSLQLVVHGDVDVSVVPSNETDTPGRVTVTWVDAGPTPDPNNPCSSGGHYEAEATTVDWEVRNGSPGDGTVEVTNGTRELETVGASVTLSETDSANGTRLDLWVTAVHGEKRTVILDRAVTL